MKVIKYLFRFLLNKNIVLLNIGILAVFIFVYITYNISEFEQSTWIYSASMQTLATLIALLPISYGYYISNLDNEKKEDFDSYVINKLKRDVYYEMMTVIFIALLVIILNLIAFFIETEGVFSFVIAYLTIVSIGYITIYIYRLFDPNKVSDILKEFDISVIEPGQKEVTLDEFISEYLELENIVKDLITNENDNDLISNVPLYDIIDIYSKDYPELKEHYDTFKEIIFHRNNVIHNYVDVQVDYTKYIKIIDLKKKFKRYNLDFVQKNIFTNVLSVKQLIEEALKEFQLSEYMNIPDISEEVNVLLHSYFVSDYYECVSDEQQMDVDFEIIQNNYSNMKLVGIDSNQVNTKNIFGLAKSYFSRFQDRYLYLFKIIHNSKTNEFTVFYQTKDKKIKQFSVPYQGNI